MNDAELVERDLGARPDGLDRARRGEVARLARRARTGARGRRPPARVRRRRGRPLRRGRAPRDGRLVARAGGAAPGLPAGVVPRPRHDAPVCDPRGSSRSSICPRALFVAASKSGSTLETRSHADYFWELTGARRAAGSAVTDPGSQLESLARERGFAAVFSGEPTIGGRYSALSPFGMVPAALMGDRRRAAPRPRARDGRGVPPRRGQPGPRARALARPGLARRPRQGLRSLTWKASVSGSSS